MRAISMSVLGLVLLAGAAHAGPRRDCSKPAIRKVRAEADKAIAAKDYPRAIALLEPLLHDCGGTESPSDRAWLASDLAVVYQRNGQYVECERLMAPLSHPRSGLRDAGSEKLVKAIEYNLDTCSKALDAKYAAIKPGGCTLTVDHAVATAAAPAALLPRGTSAACVALLPGKPKPRSDDGDPEIRDVVCPVVAVVWKGGKSTLERKDLAANAGAVAEENGCCNLSAIAAGTQGGKTLIRVRGQGLACGGGNSDTASDTIYEWNGGALAVSLDASVVFQ
jgi:hypothetical protein